MDDLTTVVLELQGRVDQATEAFQSFADTMTNQFQTLESEINGHFDNIQTKATETADHFEREGKRAGEGFRSGVEVSLGALGLTFILALRKAYEEGLQMVEQFKVLSAITGDAPGKLLQFQFALQQLGIPADNMRLILAMLQSRVAALGRQSNQSKGPIHELGLSTKDLANKDAITQVEILADRIKTLDTASQNLAVRQLFGFRGAVLLPLLQQGQEGIERLMAAFKPPPPEVFEAFDHMNMALKELHMTWLSFSMELLTPFIEGLTVLVNKATDFINTLRRLPEEVKLGMLVSAISLAAIGFEQLTILIGSFLVQGALVRGIIVILQSFVVPLRIIAGLAIVIAAAWESNWANIRTIVESTFAILADHANDFRAIWAIIVSTFESQIIPAFMRLGVAIGDILTPLLSLGTGILDNNSAWNDFIAVIDVVVAIITNIINVLTFLAQNFETVATVIITVLVSRALPALVTGFVGLVTAVGTAITSIVTFGTTATASMVAAATAGEGLTGVFVALRTALFGVAAGEDAVFPPMVLLQAAALALGAAVVGVQTNFMGMRDQFILFLQNIADAESAIARLLDAFVQLSDHLGIIGSLFLNVGNDAGQMADMFSKAADQTERLATALRDKDSAASDTKGWTKDAGKAAAMGWWGDQGGGWGATKTPKPPSGSGHLLADTGKKKSKDETSTWLDALKDKLIPLQIALENADAAFKQLEEHIKQIGTIDTPQKLQKAMQDYGAEAGVANRELALQRQLVTGIDQQLAAVKAHLASTSNVKDRHSLLQEELSLTKERNSELLKQTQLEGALKDINQKELETQQKYADSISKDDLNSWSSRIAAASDYYNWTVRTHQSIEDQHKALKDVLDLEKTRTDLAAKLQSSQADVSAAQAKAEKPSTTGATGSVKAILDAQASYVASLTKLNTAQDELTAAQENYNTLVAKGAANTEDGINAEIAVNQAQTAYYNALDESNNALQKFNEQANYLSTELTKNFDQLAKQVGGPVYNAFISLADYLKGDFNNALLSVQGMFMQVFEKTLAYKDVEVAVMEITQTLALVLNDLRPILDFLIGIVLGVINVFISMYDVVVMILDAFGLMIQKIKLLNSDLQNMNAQAVPLIQIIHDLPTINEYNQGYWAQLIGQQDAANNNLNDLNSDILQGFDKTASKLGEIVGILLAIKVILGLAGGQSLAGSITSVFSFFQRMFGAGPEAAGSSGSPLGQAFMSLTGSTPAQFQQSINQFVQTGQKIATSVTQFGTATQVGQQSAQIGQTASGVDKIASTTQQVASNTQGTAATTQGTAATTQQTSATTFTTAITLFQTAVALFEAAVTQFEAGSFLGGLLSGAMGGGGGIPLSGGPSGNLPVTAGLGAGGPIAPAAGGGSFISNMQDAFTNALDDWSATATLNVATLLSRSAAPAAGGGGSFSSSQSQTALEVNFNGDSYGFDSSTLYNKLKPVFVQLMSEYQYDMALFTRSNNYAFTRGLSAV